jgi:hypothetical protein
MRATSLLTAVLLVCTTGLVLAAATVTLQNRSSYAIHHLYLSPSAQEDWGPDQLGEDLVEAGARFDLRNVPPDRYDIMLVDEDGDACVLTDIDIAASQTWRLADDMLLECEGFGP